MSSQHGSAHVVVDKDVHLCVKVKSADGSTVVQDFWEIDCEHIGAQIKFDILNDSRYTMIPEDMRNHPEQCRIVLCVNEHRVPMDDYQRLLYYREYLNGAPATLYVLEPDAQIVNETLPVENLGVKKTGTALPFSQEAQHNTGQD